MTKISIYNVDGNVAGNDRWIGTDAQNFNATKNFTPNGLADYFNHNQVIDSGNALRYTYQTLDPLEARRFGTISFITEIGPQVPFADISTFLLSKYTLKYNIVSEYLQFLNGAKVVLSKASDTNFFGLYQITGVSVYLPEPNFFNVTLSFIDGNGSMNEDQDYIISLVLDKYDQPVTNTSQLINDGEDGVHPFITAQDIPPSASTLQEVTDNGNTTTNTISTGNITATDVSGGDAPFTGSFNSDDNSSLLSFTNLKIGGNSGVLRITDYSAFREWILPNQTGTIALTSDIPVIDTPTLQQVLNAGHALVNGNNFQGTDAGSSNTGVYINAFGETAVSHNSGNYINAFGSNAANTNSGTGVNAFGVSAAANNSADNVNAFGGSAGLNNTYSHVNLFGVSATADENGQTVFSKNGTILARLSTALLTATRKYSLPDATGTIALTSNIPTVGTWGALNYPTWTSGTPFVKMTAAGTFALDTNTYLTGITSSDVTTALGYTPVTNARTLTINGTTYDLTADRSWTIPSFTSPLTTKGDIYVRNASADARLPIGLDTQILMADSTQATGMKWASNTAATPTGYYGAWQDNVTQTAAVSNTGYPMIFRTTDLSNGVSVVSNGTNLTRITFANTGIYNLQFSSQFQNTDNAQHDITIWLRLNGVDVPGSSGLISIPARKAAGAGNEGHIISGWNYVLSVVSGQYYELVWSTSNAANVTMQYYAAGSPPPAAASVIMTVTQQSGIMAGTGMTALTTTGTSGPATYNSGTGILNVPQYMSASTRRNANNSTNSNINYCGVALGTGVSDSSAVWTIKRLTIASSGSITIATATNVAWTNRETAIYT